VAEHCMEKAKKEDWKMKDFKGLICMTSSSGSYVNSRSLFWCCQT
jgi:hypothetical protein